MTIVKIQLGDSEIPIAGVLRDEDGAARLDVGVRLFDENGNLAGLKQINNKLRVSSMPYLYDISEGNVPGHSEFEQFGYNADIDTAVEDVWSVGGSYVFPAAAQQLELVSTSIEDDPDKGAGVPGTGIHTVTIYYLTNDFTEKSEDVNLNGTGVVTTAGSDIFRINSVRAKACGTGGAAAGVISIRNLADTPVYSQIEVGNTRSRNAIYTVPKAKILYIASMSGGIGYASTAANPSNSVLLTIRAKYDHLAGALRSFFLPHAEIQVGSGAGTVYRPFEIPLKFIAGVDIKVSAICAANNGSISCGLRGWLE